MGEVTYSIPQLRKLYALSVELCFWDDAVHWANELRKRGEHV